MKLSVWHKLIRFLFFLIPIVFAGLVVGVWIYLQTHSYQQIIQRIVDDLHRPDLKPILESTYFPIHKLKVLKYTIGVFALMSCIGIFLLVRCRGWYSSRIDQLVNDISFCKKLVFTIYSSFSKIAKVGFWFVILIVCFRAIYYATTFDVQYDEAWNYNLFLDKQFYYPLAAYNNYPLHNLVTWVFVHVFGVSTFVLRLPVILMGLLTMSYLIFAVQHVFKNQWMSLLLGGIFASLPVTVFYMMYARGVIFEIFFAVLVSSLMWYFVAHQFNTKRVICLSILNALGTWSMLSHPYFIVASFVSLLIYSLLVNRHYVKLSILYLITSILFSLLLFIPMMLGTGVSPGINATVGHLAPSSEVYLTHFNDLSYFITGFHLMFNVFTVILVISLFYSFSRNKNVFFISLCCLSLLSMNVMIPLILHSFPPERALSFMVIIPLVILLCLFLCLQKLPHSRVWMCLITVIIVTVSAYRAHTHHFLIWSKELDHKVKEVAQLFQHEHISYPYNQSRDFDYFIPGITYYFKQQHQQIEFGSSSPQSTRYSTVINAATDCIILHKDRVGQMNLNATEIYRLDDFVILKLHH